MSGGAFEYIQSKSIYEFLDNPSLFSLLEGLISEASYGGFHAIANESQMVLNKLQRIRKEIQELDDSLGSVYLDDSSLRHAWKAMDFGFAGDWTFEDIEKANEKQK